MIDSTATREAARARLPELEASNAELGALLKSLLSPSVVAALKTAPGSPNESIAPVGDAPSKATALLRELDSRLPAIRAARSTETVN